MRLHHHTNLKTNQVSRIITSGTDDNTKEINDGGADVLSADSTSKHSHHDNNSGDPEKNTPFKLPFP